MSTLNPKQAAAIAKTYVGDLFSDEGVSDIQLEEVEYDYGNDLWLVTVSFRRSPVHQESSGLSKALESVRARPHKIIKIADRHGDVLSITDRRLSAA